MIILFIKKTYLSYLIKLTKLLLTSEVEPTAIYCLNQADKIIRFNKIANWSGILVDIVRHAIGSLIDF